MRTDMYIQGNFREIENRYIPSVFKWVLSMFVNEEMNMYHTYQVWSLFHKHGKINNTY